MACDSLLHDIAKSKAQRCFDVLKNQFSNSVWDALNQYRIEEQRPIDVAASRGHRVMFQVFKGYRHGNGLPTLTWIAAQQLAQTNHPHLFVDLDEMIEDAKEDQAYQTELDNWQGEDQIEKDAQDHAGHRCYGPTW
ncbi:MAG TPA: hypothetical protein PLD88_04440 [Candidatus Berkiella sp.]|nr:hypothetical protein [Candidatus Berkiella sp.]